MKVNTIIGLEKKDVVVENGLDAALSNLWDNETFRGQVLQAVLKALSDKGFEPQKIEWKIDESGYVLLMIVGQALKRLTEQAIEEEVIPFIKSRVEGHRDFKPTS